ncbi:MAG: DeoR/GlpR family DNA-binding transcription regulator [Lachnospiraceae bacterium]|nr:DeoR/GlpR family DNA-binding transcription regulator [Lachnospiraceae bacterium]
MKNSRDIVDNRRTKLLAIIEKTGDVRVPDIASHLNVSEITVRRDLQYLEDQRIIERYYGGARIRQSKPKKVMSDIMICRENIAREAASFVSDGDTIFINTSSTAIEMLKYITAKDVTVITNNGNAVVAQKPYGVRVILTGGELYNVKGTLVGEFAKNNIMRVTAKNAFIGCAAFSLENGMMSCLLNEVDLNHAMVSRTTEDVFLLADHTKLGKNSSFTSCSLSEISYLITDDRAPADFLESIKKEGIEVTCVSSVQEDSAQ